MTARVGIQIPPDGFTELEKELSKIVAANTVQSLYAKLPTSRMKAIVALHFELGYTEEEVAEMFGISQERLSVEITNIKKILTGKRFRPHMKPNSIRMADLISLCFSLAQP